MSAQTEPGETEKKIRGTIILIDINQSYDNIAYWDNFARQILQGLIKEKLPCKIMVRVLYHWFEDYDTFALTFKENKDSASIRVEIPHKVDSIPNEILDAIRELIMGIYSNKEITEKELAVIGGKFVSRLIDTISRFGTDLLANDENFIEYGIKWSVDEGFKVYIVETWAD